MIFFLVLVLIAGVGVTDYLSLPGSLALAGLVALIAMLLREWWFIDVSRNQSELRKLVRGLDRATSSSHAEYEEEVHQIWYVDSDGNDRGRIRFVTSVIGSDTMAWRRVKAFANEDLGMPSVSTMRFRASEGDAEIESFRVKESASLVDYLVFFSRPIKDSDNGREWTVDFRWPGLWKPLKDHGEDHCSLEVTVPASSASIRVVFPTDLVDPPTRFVSRSPLVGSERAEQYEGAPSILWEIGPCEPGKTFRANIKTRPIEG